MVDPEYATTVFAPVRNDFRIGSNCFMDQLWTPAAQKGALELMRAVMERFYRVKSAPASIQAYGIAVFKLADWQVRSMHIASGSEMKPSELIYIFNVGFTSGHFYLEDYIRMNASSTSTFRPPATKRILPIFLASNVRSPMCSSASIKFN